MSRRKRGTLALLPKLPLLITESSDEFDHIADAIYQELKPSGAIKQLYTADIIELSWEISVLAALQSRHRQSYIPARLEDISQATFAAARARRL